MAVSNRMKAEEYYKLIGEKNVEGIKKYLDHDVEFYSPLACFRQFKNENERDQKLRA